MENYEAPIKTMDIDDLIFNKESLLIRHVKDD
jgi:hypothetical protein